LLYVASIAVAVRAHLPRIVGNGESDGKTSVTS
jgi:hypothetical protein